MYMAMWGEIGCLPDGYSGCYQHLKDVVEDVSQVFPELSTVNLRTLQRDRIIYRSETRNRQGEYNLVVGATLIEIATMGSCESCDNWVEGECYINDMS